MEDVKDELQERYKVLPGLNMRIETLEKHYEDMREKNRQLEQKLAAMQVCVCEAEGERNNYTVIYNCFFKDF